jgi:hypothetical protein
VIWTNVGESIFQLSSASPSWASATFTARYGVIYDAQSGVAATEPLLVLVDFGIDESPSAATFQVTTPGLGWWWETAA